MFFSGDGQIGYNPPPLGQVAQLVEQRTENPRVDGSIPPLATIFKSPNSFRAFSRLPVAPVLAGLRGFASRASPLNISRFWPSPASLFPVLSVCLASVREVSYCIDAGFCAVGCGWQLLEQMRHLLLILPGPPPQA